MSEENKALIIATPKTPAEFVKENVDQFIESIRAQAREFEWPEDLSKKTARAKVRSFASQTFTKPKTAADKSGKNLVAPMKKQIKIVDEGRKVIRDTLDKEKAEFLKPVVEWEAAEEAREKSVQGAINEIKSYQLLYNSLPSEDYQTALEDLEKFNIESGNYGDRQPEAREEKDRSEKFLKLMLENAVNREKEAVRKAKEEEEAREKAEKEKQEQRAKEVQENNLRSKIKEMDDLGNVLQGTPLEVIDDRISTLSKAEITSEIFGDFFELAINAREAAWSKLRNAKKAEEARQEREAEEKRVADIQEKIQSIKDFAKLPEKASAAFIKTRLNELRAIVIKGAGYDEFENHALEAQAQADMQLQAALEKTEQREQEERDKEAKEALKAQKEKEKKEADKRAADKEHRSRIDAEILEDLLQCGFTNEIASKLRFHFQQNDIRHVEVKY